MKIKAGSFISILLFFSLLSQAQVSELFKKVDSKHSFKDVAFGTSFNIAKSKLGLIKSNIGPSAYVITKETYQSLGMYYADFGFAMFNKDSLTGIGLMFLLKYENDKEKYIDYFHTMLGESKYDEKRKYYTWLGDNLYYTLYVSIVDKQSAINIIIKSTQFGPANGAENF